MVEFSWTEFSRTTLQVLYCIHLLLHSKHLLCCIIKKLVYSSVSKLSGILFKTLESERKKKSLATLITKTKSLAKTRPQKLFSKIVHVKSQATQCK